MKPKSTLKFLLFAGASLLALPAQTISLSAPDVLPRGHGLGRYSPLIAISYIGLAPQSYMLKVWLLDTGNYYCASTQWCERTFKIDGVGGRASGEIVLVEPMDVYDYPQFLWVARLYDGSGREATSSLAPAKASGASPPELAPIGGKSGEIGRELRFTVKASASGKTALQYFARNLPPNSSFDPSTGEFKWVPAAPGAYTNLILGVIAPASGLSNAQRVEIEIR